MPEINMEKWEQPLRAMETFYAEAESHTREGNLALYERVISRIVERDQAIRTVFASAESLEAYLKAHKAQASIRRRISAEVAAKRTTLLRLSKDDGYRGVQLASTVDSYWALVHGSHVDPSAVFTEIPENASLCNY